jgi:hypothetical protein
MLSNVHARKVTEFNSGVQSYIAKDDSTVEEHIEIKQNVD